MNFMLNKKDWMLVLFVGALGALVNTFRLPLFFEAEFVFGPFLVLLVAVFRGPVPGVLTSIIASMPLVVAWGSFWPTLTFGMEALFVGYIFAVKRFNVIMLVMMYWLFIGMPVSWYSIAQYELFLDSHRTSILIKQLTNAILYAHITALLMYLPTVRNYLSRQLTITAISIKEQSSHIISSLLISVGIVFFFVGLNQTINNAGERFSYEHDSKHNQLSFHLEHILDSKINAISEFRYTLSKVWQNSELREQSLLEFNQRHAEFKTMILADKDANLINSSPRELVTDVMQQNQSINVADRDYFKLAIDTQNTVVSPGFIGRGFGNELISAVSTGVPNAENPQQNIGVLEGSFVLDSLQEVHKYIQDVSPEVNAVLVDQTNHVLIASNDLAMNTLQTLNVSKAVDTFYDHDLVSIVQEDGSQSSEVYYFAESTFDFGWKLITFQNETRFADLIEKTLIAFAVSIVMLVLIAKLLAWTISHSWSYSMHRLNEMIERGNDFNGEIVEFEDNEHMPVEVNNLYQEIKRSRLENIKMNQQLQNTVAERTEKLQTANAKLNVMAREDALTQLENRRVFTEVMQELWLDCQKNLLSMSMLIIDIDHFKKVNDSYGHPAGDDVLVQLARELEKFKVPAVECLARIGGEEFCLLFKDMTHTEVIKLANEIRQHIEQVIFHVGAEKHIHITVSAGLATIDPTKFTPTKLYQLADNGLYEAKHAGRNQVKATELK
jgi:diguanylate cyclase (GGDEF)-like protein